MHKLNQIKDLYSNYKNRSISKDELDQLIELIKTDSESENYLIGLIEEDLLDENIIDNEIINKIIQNAEIDILNRTSTKTRKIKKYSYWVAACILFLFSIGTIYYVTISQNTSKLEQITLQEDIEPGGNKAVLKISDGRSFDLDNKNNEISINNNSIVLNNNNKLGDLTEDIVDIELSTPRKGNYKAILPDGTKIWLNAESKIIYPSRFDTKNRTIKVDGEVYLEVAKHENSKFIVELSQGRKIEVLGTKFNINSYPNHKYIKTSLIEGKIKFINHFGKSAILLPNYKVVSSNIENNIMVSATNIDNDLAWINNKFNFEDLSFEEIMMQIARWYDVRIIYQSKVPDVEFYGELNKNNSLKYLIEVFQQSGVNMKIKNKTLIIE